MSSKPKAKQRTVLYPKGGIKLFPQEDKLLRRVVAAGHRGATVAQIGSVVFSGKTLAKLRKDRRKMHQRVGTIVFRVNRKRRSLKIVPDPERAAAYVLHRTR